MWADATLILSAYLLGSVPHLSLLAKLRRIELNGDFHESLWYRAGRHFGVIGVVGEFTKGILPILVGKSLGFSLAIIAWLGLQLLVVRCGAYARDPMDSYV